MMSSDVRDSGSVETNKESRCCYESRSPLFTYMKNLKFPEWVARYVTKFGCQTLMKGYVLKFYQQAAKVSYNPTINFASKTLNTHPFLNDEQNVYTELYVVGVVTALLIRDVIAYATDSGNENTNINITELKARLEKRAMDYIKRLLTELRIDKGTV